jgi:hypothetical protein
MIAVQSQLTAIKHDVLAAQVAAKAKHGSGASGSCQVHLLPSSSTGNSASNLLSDGEFVLGLAAGPFLNAGCEESHDFTGSDLKKRKRMLALQNGEESSFAADGDEGNIVIGTNVSHGGMLK